MIGLWKQLKINIDYQPPQRLSFKTYFHKFSTFMTDNQFITCQPATTNLEFRIYEKKIKGCRAKSWVQNSRLVVEM